MTKYNPEELRQWVIANNHNSLINEKVISYISYKGVEKWITKGEYMISHYYQNDDNGGWKEAIRIVKQWMAEVDKERERERERERNPKGFGTAGTERAKILN